jgi:hypothetical protein
MFAVVCHDGASVSIPSDILKFGSEEVMLEKVYFRVPAVFPLQLLFHHCSIFLNYLPSVLCDNPDQAAYYRTLGLYVEALSMLHHSNQLLFTTQ